METVTFKTTDLQKELDNALQWARAEVHCTFISNYVGGQPASQDGVEMFCKHQLGLTDENEIKLAAGRILMQEIGEIEPDAKEGELKDAQSYAVNVIRRTEAGEAFIGTWQVRAMLKQAASRLGVFTKTRGSKGDMAEMMLVHPVGNEQSQEIVIHDRDGKPWVDPLFQTFRGCVSTPQGRKSIVHDSEVAPKGCSFSFCLRWPCSKVTKKKMLAILAAGQNIGLGSVKSLEHGRFEVLEVTMDKNLADDDED